MKLATIRWILIVALSKNWSVRHLNFNNAFLNGDMHEIVYMSHPESFVSSKFPRHVCTLKKVLYGLEQAP